MPGLTNEKILVTGGTGFAGRYAIKQLVEDGQSVYALVRSKEKLQGILGTDVFERSNLKVIEMQNPENTTVPDLTSLIEEEKITTIMNKYYETNVLWTKNLALAFLGAKVSHNKFIFTSSVGVYGTIPKKVPANEETPYNPDGKYHKSKVLAEKELLELKSRSNLPLIILRPTIMYGNEDTGFLLKIFRLMAKKIFPLAKSNTCIHLLDVQLLAQTYSELANPNTKLNDFVFNVADKQPVKIKDMSNYIRKSMDARYRSIPSFVFSLLRKVLSINGQYSVSVKLISQNWGYNVDRLYGQFNFKPVDTIQVLDEKYISWYKKAGSTR